MLRSGAGGGGAGGSGAAPSYFSTASSYVLRFSRSPRVEYARRRFQNYACQSNSNETATTCQGLESCEEIEDKQKSLKCWAQNEVTKCKCHERETTIAQ